MPQLVQLTLDEVVDLLPPATGRGVQLEGPQEVGRVLEVRPDSHDLHTNWSPPATGARFKL
jgi:hypothetical protein